MGSFIGPPSEPWVPALANSSVGSSPARWRARELHVGRAADVGGADEEDLEGFVGCGRRVRRWVSTGGRRWRSSLLDQRRGPAAASGSRGAEVEVAGFGEGVDDVLEGVVDGAAGGVDADVGVLRLLVGGGDAGELGDLAAAGLGVEALAVAALALLERGGDVDEEERAAGLVDHGADLLAGLVEGGDGADDREAAVAGDLGGDPADAADVGLAVRLREGQAGREVAAHDVAVEGGDGAGALLEDAVHQRLGQGGLAAAGEAGEEEDEPLLLGPGLVGLDDGRDVGGVRGVVADVGQCQHVGVAGVRARHLGTERVVDRRVAAAGQRHGDHRRVLEACCGSEGRADERGGRQVGGAGADEGQQQHRAGAAQAARAGARRAPRRPGRPCGRGAARAPARGRGSTGGRGRTARASAAPPPRPGPRRAPGADPPGPPARRHRRLRPSVWTSSRERQGHRAAGLVEGDDRVQRASRQQLEVVELAGGGAVLRVTHRSILTDSVEIQRHRARPLRCRGMTGPVVVAEIVRSGIVEGHHYGSVVALRADGTVEWSVGDVSSPVLAALVEQADPGARDGRAGRRPAARSAGAGLRVPLGRGTPPGGRAAHPGRRRAGRGGAADTCGLAARRGGARGDAARWR